jgi:non-specific protein-tyrosine kinase
LQTVLLTSADEVGEKSIAVANLAVVMAQTGARVLVVDGDLRRPQQHELFGVSNHKGLSTWLAEPGSPPIQESSLENLWVLPAGPTPANPAALLSTRHLESVLTDLRDRAEMILVDAPPVLAVTDAALWASKVDGVILMLYAGRTQREHAQRAKAVLEKVQAHLLGAVLLNAEQDVAVAGYRS